MSHNTGSTIKYLDSVHIISSHSTESIVVLMLFQSNKFISFISFFSARLMHDDSKINCSVSLRISLLPY